MKPGRFPANLPVVSAFAEPTCAWEPVTPRGVAAFARASFGRLFLVQSLAALIAAAAVGWFLARGIFPTVDAAVDALPDRGEIRHGRLDWHDDSPALLAEGGVLAFIVDLRHDGAVRSPADFALEFGTNSVLVYSLLGPAEFYYPPDYAPGTYLPANKPDLQPLWGAWRPNLLALAVIATFLGLLLVWFGLATIYCLPVWLICFFGHRDVGLLGAWRLAGASLLPGALLLSITLVLYELGVCDLVQTLFIFGLHLVIGWIYLFVAPLFLRRGAAPKTGNPFTAGAG